MKNQTIKFNNLFGILLIVLLLLYGASSSFAQQRIKWLRVTELQGPYSNLGGEYEGMFNTTNGDFFSWPADYGIEQNTIRSRALWIGCTNFDDPIYGVHRNFKVVGVGPRDAPTDRPNQILEYDIKLFGKYAHPVVTVDDLPATQNDSYDKLDGVDPNLEADRVIIAKFNTSVGLSCVKKVMAFASPPQSQYHVNDYVFKNTGIYNRSGSVSSQTLHGVYFFFNFRNCFAGEANSGYGQGWAGWAMTWGKSTVNHNIGDDKTDLTFTNPASPLYHMRAYYSWYAPLTCGGTDIRTTVNYAEDWGCPNEQDDGIMAAAKYGGIVTLHADVSTSDQSDDLNQPTTTWYVGSDRGEFQVISANQYDDLGMSGRYTLISEGHPSATEQNDFIVDDDCPQNHLVPGRIDGGGASQDIAYGPYEIAPGDSIHIVFAEGIGGISREKNREVGGNWIQWRNATGTPTLRLPNNTTTTDFNGYKRSWMEVGKDTIVQIYRRAMANYQANYQVPKPPPPPSSFKVISGGDQIALEWATNAESDPHFNGYVIYRSVSNVLTPKTYYTKIKSFTRTEAIAAAGHYYDLTPVRGLRYFYYIQSKDDGTQVRDTLYSSLFWTITNLPATLQRPAGDYLGELRVVPNPYDIRSRQFQFGNRTLDDHDQIAFYGLPPKCKMKIFTERGDLIWERTHSKGTGDELWTSETMSSQILVSGIYIVYIEVTEDTYALTDIRAKQNIYGDDLKVPLALAGDIVFHQGDLMFHKGDSKFRKFVIIR
jgi:hypothetical protein